MPALFFSDFALRSVSIGHGAPPSDSNQERQAEPSSPAGPGFPPVRTAARIGGRASSGGCGGEGAGTSLFATQLRDNDVEVLATAVSSVPGTWS